MKDLLKILPILISFSILSPALAAAPRFYLDQTNQAVAGNVFSVRVLLDTDQAANAYSVTLRYSEDLLKFDSFNDSRSIIDVWQNKSARSGEIKLSGGSLNPFNGQSGELITVNFKTLKSGGAGIAFGDSGIYLADGKGTKVLPASGVLQIAIGELGALTPPNVPSDKTPPQVKFLSLEPDPFNKEQKFLTFLASDAHSGVKTTEVRTISFLWWDAWAEVQNPAVLPASAWAVEFRAIDNSGNLIDKVTYDWPAFRKLIIASGTAVGAILFAWFL